MVRSLLSFSSPSADKGMTSVSLQCQTLDLSSITERKKKSFVPSHKACLNCCRTLTCISEFWQGMCY